MILTEVEINIEDAFDHLSSKQEDERKIFLSYIAANYPDSIQFIKE